MYILRKILYNIRMALILPLCPLELEGLPVLGYGFLVKYNCSGHYRYTNVYFRVDSIQYKNGSSASILPSRARKLVTTGLQLLS